MIDWVVISKKGRRSLGPSKVDVVTLALRFEQHLINTGTPYGELCIILSIINN
jgi:hypothetical protein